ncbi:hypothetical protein ACHAPJ_004945 [Fusarium lateritium]
MCGFTWSRRSSTFTSNLWFKFLNFITHLCGENESAHADEPASANLEPINADNEPVNDDQVNPQAPSESSSSSWTTITYESEPAPVVETPAQRIQKWVEGISSGEETETRKQKDVGLTGNIGPPPSVGKKVQKVQRVQNWVEGIASGTPSSAGEAAQPSV